jgi:hypothetical protein
MNSPGSLSCSAEPAAAPVDRGPRHELRVHGERGHSAAPTAAMPRAKTDLAELLAGDKVLCVQRRSDRLAAAHAAASAPLSANDTISSVPAAVDADLARLNAAWPALPADVRAAIAALAGQTTAGEEGAGA